jgi:hypothetical protein
MEIRENNTICIFAPLSTNLNKRETQRLISNLKKETRKIALDLSHVTDCTIDFLENIKVIATEKNMGIFNINSVIFTLFLTMNLDKSLNLFVNEIDFIENSRQLLKRDFSLVY